MAKALSDGGARPTMFQMTPRMIARLDHIAEKLVINRSQLARQIFEEWLPRAEAVHGAAPEREIRSLLPNGVGPFVLDNDRLFWVNYKGDQGQLKESIIVERYMLKRQEFPGVLVCLVGSQEWKSPEEYGIKVPAIFAPPLPPPTPSEMGPPPLPSRLHSAAEAVPKAEQQSILPPAAPNAPPAFIQAPPMQILNPPEPIRPPAPPKVERKFHAWLDGKVQNKLESEIQSLLDAGQNIQICLEGDTGWKMAGDYGLVPNSNSMGAANGNGMESRSGTPTLI